MTDKAATPEDTTSAHRGTETRVVAIAGLLVVAIGLAGFAGWFAHGDKLFWSMLQAGLAWCG